jgi:flagellar motor switch/type III secretory pathway protein FliN
MVVPYSMEASLAAGHALMPLSAVGWKEQSAGVGAYSQFLENCHSVTEKLAEVLHNFWGLSAKVVFFGLSDKTQAYWKMDDFHVSQLSLESIASPTSQAAQGAQATQQAGQATPMALLRLSDSACDMLLARVLGELANPFSFKRLSPLEGTILNEFSRDILAYFKKALIKKAGRISDSPLIHVVWLIQLEPAASPQANASQTVLADLPVGKIIFSVPKAALKQGAGLARPDHEASAENSSVADSFFFHVQAAQPIYLGSTRVQLADLDQLEAEDLMVLENSRPNQMFLINPVSGEKVPFSVEIQHQERITIPYTQEFAPMETQSVNARQSLWDNLMIEVEASFEPIKLPLKQLKQMTEGLVIEMGDLVHNRIALQVEGKTLAWGELLIVGDKFAVRVSRVAANPGNEEDARALRSQEVESEEYTDEGSADEDEEYLDEDFDDDEEDGEEEDW